MHIPTSTDTASLKGDEGQGKPLSGVTIFPPQLAEIWLMNLVTFFVIELVQMLVSGWKQGKRAFAEKELKQINR